MLYSFKPLAVFLSFCFLINYCVHMPSLHDISRSNRIAFYSSLFRYTTRYFGPPPPGFPPVPAGLFRVSTDLYSKTLQMTKTCSHITFLGSCLRKHRIPNGFQVHLQLTNLNPLVIQRVREIERHTSLQLIRTQLSSLQFNREQLKSAISNLKSQLRIASAFSPVIFNLILQNIRELNQQIFIFLKDSKQNKLARLLDDREPRSLDQHRRVFSIPEDLPLSVQECTLLSRGLSFAPCSKTPDIFQVRHEAEKFFRSLRLRAYFSSLDPPQLPTVSPDIFQKINPSPSSFTPLPGTFGALDTYISTCRRMIWDLDLRTNQRNLNPSEIATLRALRRRQDIVVKSADKGGAVVVWRRDLYEAEGLSQLSDLRYYEPLVEDPTPKYQLVVTKTVNDAIRSGTLPSTAKRLIVDCPRTPVFYMLPKIHKPNNPGRPIVSACSCPTEHISSFIDSILQPIVCSLPSYIKDTNHVLKLLSNVRLTGNIHWLVTFDITSLYTVIPHEAGLEALRFFLDRRSSCDPPTDIILKLASLVLKLTGFSFLDKFYKQTCGISMGTKMGPSFANIFVGFAEHKFFSSWQDSRPLFYGRFIDDGLMIVECSENELETLIRKFEHLHPSLELKFNFSRVSIEFLDLIISISGVKISTSLFQKPTCAHNLLRFDSCHPKHTKLSVPYSQFLRLRRICSNDKDFNQKADAMQTNFQHRAYPLPLIISARVKASNPINVRSTRVSNRSSPLAAVFTFHPSLSSVTSILRNNFSILCNDAETRPIFENSRLLFSFKRHQNFRSMLMRSALSVSQPNVVAGTFPCSRPRCKTCCYTSGDTMITTNTSSYTILGRFSCTSEKVIYCISCKLCPKMHYIGETQNKLAERFTQHRFDIKHNNPTTGVAKHFNLPGHGLQHISIRVLKIVKGLVSVRRLLENRIIFQLGTNYPSGMNDQPRFLT